MKKVAIVSCYFQKNYGSMLQAFATQQIVTNLGYENETICIDGFAKTIRNAKLKYYIFQIDNIQVLLSKIVSVKKFIRQLYDVEFRRNCCTRDEKFHIFKTKYFNISRCFKSLEELKKYCENYRSVIVGSDQLWLPSNIAADYYTLNFVPGNINKISYATSFGVKCLPAWQKKIARNFLDKIQHLSVREKKGQKIIWEISGRKAQLVCDPTLLLNAEEWLKYFPKKQLIKGKYILCYFLGNNPSHRKFACKLKEHTGYKIVALLHLDEFIKEDAVFPDEMPYDVGPIEFINLIREASYILTDSFHGTVFSVLHKKKFFTFKRFSDKSAVSTNSRIDTLLHQFELEKRLEPKWEDVKSYLGSEIYYENVFKEIERMRKDSLTFLRTALKSTENKNS